MTDLSTLLSEMKIMLRYEPDTGKFFWQNAGMRSGKEAGNKRKDGYLELCYNQKKYLVHRLAWLFTYGKWPLQIDHINHDKADNRIINLRSTDARGNQFNRAKLQSNNTTGVNGVSRTRDGYYIVRKGRKYLGHSLSLETATRMRENYCD